MNEICVRLEHEARGRGDLFVMSVAFVEGKAAGYGLEILLRAVGAGCCDACSREFSVRLTERDVASQRLCLECAREAVVLALVDSYAEVVA